MTEDFIAHQTGGTQPKADSSLSEEQSRTKKNLRIGKQRTLREKWRLTSLSNKFISLATVVIAGAGILQFGTAVFQWKEMRDAGRQTDKLIRKATEQAEATNNLAGETKRLADIAIDAERPWVGVSDFDPKTFVTGVSGNIAVMTVSVLNAGKSPADILLLEIAQHKYKAFPQKPDYGSPLTKPSRTLLLPGSKLTVVNNITVTKDDAAELAVQKATLYIYGHIEYRDVRTNKAHTTHFCERYIPDRTAFFICPTYNDAD